MSFDGITYDRPRDGKRLSTQLRLVHGALLTGRWFTLAELAEISHGSEASVSARIRDLRKPRFGGYEIEREYVSRGLWRYRLVPKQWEQADLFASARR